AALDAHARKPSYRRACALCARADQPHLALSAARRRDLRGRALLLSPRRRLAALYEAMNESRGGSTITMQTAKNLFLWPSRSYIRKAIEIPVAMTIDALWPKRRILEVYLNIAEWGPGI